MHKYQRYALLIFELKVIIFKTINASVAAVPIRQISVGVVGVRLVRRGRAKGFSASVFCQ